MAKKRLVRIKFVPDHSMRLNARLSSRNEGCPEHTHDCTELAIVLKGSARHVINGRPHFAKAGDVYVIKPGVSHGFKEMKDFVHYVFSYMPEMLDSIGPDLRQMPGYQTLFAIGHGRASSDFDSLLRLSMKSLGRVEELVESIIEEFEKGRPGCESLVKARFVELVVLLSREFSEKGAPFGTPLDIERAAKLASRLESHFKEPPRLAVSARELGVSERQLRRIFLRHYGMPPVDYLMKVRADRAARLLNSSDMTLSEIAFECGFSDANYFSRQFKRSAGLAPSAWRAKQGGHR